MDARVEPAHDETDQARSAKRHSTGRAATRPP